MGSEEEIEKCQLNTWTIFHCFHSLPLAHFLLSHKQLDWLANSKMEGP